MPFWNVLGPLFLTPWVDNHHHYNKKSPTEDILSVATWAVPLFPHPGAVIEASSPLPSLFVFFAPRPGYRGWMALLRSLDATYHQSRCFTLWELQIRLRRSPQIYHILDIYFLPSGGWWKSICTRTTRQLLLPWGCPSPQWAPGQK